MRAGVALRAHVFPPAVRARVAHHTHVFHLAVGAGVALHAALFHLAFGTRVALRAAAFQLAVEVGVALHTISLFLSMRAPFLSHRVSCTTVSRILHVRPRAAIACAQPLTTTVSVASEASVGARHESARSHEVRVHSTRTRVFQKSCTFQFHTCDSDAFGQCHVSSFSSFD